MKFSEFVPIIQSMIWPIFLAALIYIFRGWLKEVLDLIKQRIEAGSELGVGPGGVTIGAVPKLPDEPDSDDLIEDEGQNATTSPDLESRSDAILQKEAADPVESLQLVHRSRFSRIKNGRNYYSIEVSPGRCIPTGARPSRARRVLLASHLQKSNPRG